MSGGIIPNCYRGIFGGSEPSGPMDISSAPSEKPRLRLSEIISSPKDDAFIPSVFSRWVFCWVHIKFADVSLDFRLSGLDMECKFVSIYAHKKVEQWNSFNSFSEGN